MKIYKKIMLKNQFFTQGVIATLCMTLTGCKFLFSNDVYFGATGSVSANDQQIVEPIEEGDSGSPVQTHEVNISFQRTVQPMNFNVALSADHRTGSEMVSEQKNYAQALVDSLELAKNLLKQHQPRFSYFNLLSNPDLSGHMNSVKLPYGELRLNRPIALGAVGLDLANVDVYERLRDNWSNVHLITSLCRQAFAPIQNISNYSMDRPTLLLADFSHILNCSPQHNVSMSWVPNGAIDQEPDKFKQYFISDYRLNIILEPIPIEYALPTAAGARQDVIHQYRIAFINPLGKRIEAQLQPFYTFYNRNNRPDQEPVWESPIGLPALSHSVMNDLFDYKLEAIRSQILHSSRNRPLDMDCRDIIPESVLTQNLLKRSELISCKSEIQIAYVQMPIISGSREFQKEYTYRVKNSPLPLTAAPTCSTSTQNIQIKSGNEFIDISETDYKSFIAAKIPERSCASISIRSNFNADSTHGVIDPEVIANLVVKPFDFIPASKRSNSAVVMIKSPTIQMNRILNAIATKLLAKGVQVHLIDKNENALETLEQVKQKLAMEAEKIASTLNNLINKPANCAEVLAVKVNGSSKQFKSFGDAADKIELIDHSPQSNDQIKLTCRQ
jgi:hypothetical protein